MYGIFDAQPVKDHRDELIADIEEKFDETLDKDDIYRFMITIGKHLNLQAGHIGDSISFGFLGSRREYGSYIIRGDGAEYQLITQSYQNLVNQGREGMTAEELAAEPHRRVLREPRNTLHALELILDWLDEFDLDEAIESLGDDITAAVDAAETERAAIMAAAEFPIYAWEARRIYAGIPLDERVKDREVKAAFLERWHERTGR